MGLKWWGTPTPQQITLTTPAKFTVGYPAGFVEAHADPEPTTDPRFTWMLPFYGATVAAFVEHYVTTKQLHNRGALVGILAEGFDTINETVTAYYPDEAPIVTRTYEWSDPQIDLRGDEFYLRKRKARDVTFVETPQNFRAWIVAKPLRLFV